MKQLLFILLLLAAFNSYSQTNKHPWVTYKIVKGIKNSTTQRIVFQKADLTSRVYIFLLNDQIKIKDRGNSVYFIKETREGHNTDKEIKTSWWTYDQTGVDCAVETVFSKVTGTMTVKVAYPDYLYIYFVRPLSKFSKGS